jgi:hypothetical protein
MVRSFLPRLVADHARLRRPNQSAGHGPIMPAWTLRVIGHNTTLLGRWPETPYVF